MSEWQPIETAPSCIILLAVQHGDERRTMVAQISHSDNDGWFFMVTHGWDGWTRLHRGWTPMRWSPLPAPPETEGNGQ